MIELGITEYSDYDSFARDWHADTLDQHDVTLEEARDRGLINEDDTRLLWQLLGQLDDDELLIQIPEWLADKKAGYVDGATPTGFVVRIERETEKAILFADSASARPLMKIAHRISNLEDRPANGDTAGNSRAWLDARLEEHRREFENRDDITGLQDAWLPKSQVERLVRRVGRPQHSGCPSSPR